MIEQPLIVKLSAWFSSLLPSIIGSVISLKLSNDDSTFMQRLVAFCIGVALAHYIGGAIVESFGISISSLTSQSILLATGIFGMATASEIFKQLPELIKGVSDKILGLIGK